MTPGVYCHGSSGSKEANQPDAGSARSGLSAVKRLEKEARLTAIEYDATFTAIEDEVQREDRDCRDRDQR